MESVHAFIAEFTPTDIKSDPLPIKVVRKSIINRNEAVYEAVQIASTYLYTRKCDDRLAQSMLPQICEGVQRWLTQVQTEGWTPIEFMQEVVRLADEELLRFKETDNLDASKLDIMPYQDNPAGVYAISVSRLKNRRKSMEDMATVLPNLAAIFKLPEPVAFFGVFDGHCGAQAASFAAHHMYGYIVHNLQASAESHRMSLADAVKDSFTKTDKDFMEREDSRSGTTATVGVITSNRIVLGWVGDSQAMYCCGGMVKQLVNSHMPSRQDEQVRVQKMGAEIMKIGDVYRVNGALAVTRAIGDRDFKPSVTSIPDIVEIWRDEVINEEYLVIATDGLWETMNVVDVAEVVDRTVVNNRSHAAAEELANIAKLKGSEDNICITVIYLQALDTLAEMIRSRDFKVTELLEDFVGYHPRESVGIFAGIGDSSTDGEDLSEPEAEIKYYKRKQPNDQECNEDGGSIPVPEEFEASSEFPQNANTPLLPLELPSQSDIMQSDVAQREMSTEGQNAIASIEDFIGSTLPPPPVTEDHSHAKDASRQAFVEVLSTGEVVVQLKKTVVNGDGEAPLVDFSDEVPGASNLHALTNGEPLGTLQRKERNQSLDVQIGSPCIFPVEGGSSKSVKNKINGQKKAPLAELDKSEKTTKPGGKIVKPPSTETAKPKTKPPRVSGVARTASPQKVTLTTTLKPKPASITGVGTAPRTTATSARPKPIASTAVAPQRPLSTVAKMSTANDVPKLGEKGTSANKRPIAAATASAPQRLAVKTEAFKPSSKPPVRSLTAKRPATATEKTNESGAAQKSTVTRPAVAQASVKPPVPKVAPIKKPVPLSTAVKPIPTATASKKTAVSRVDTGRNRVPVTAAKPPIPRVQSAPSTKPATVTSTATKSSINNPRPGAQPTSTKLTQRPLTSTPHSTATSAQTTKPRPAPPTTTKAKPPVAGTSTTTKTDIEPKPILKPTITKRRTTTTTPTTGSKGCSASATDKSCPVPIQPQTQPPPQAPSGDILNANNGEDAPVSPPELEPEQEGGHLQLATPTLVPQEE